jgi:methylmalonyl-CoA mutase
VAIEADPTLAGVFPQPSEDQWLALVDKVLKGAPLSKLHSTTPDGIDLAPLYTRTSSPGGADEAGLPGRAPFTRGTRDGSHAEAAWGIRAPITAADPAAANRLVLRELERGATSIELHFDAAFRAAVQPSDPAFAELGGVHGVLVRSTDDLARTLEGVLFDVAGVHLHPGADFSRAALLMTEVWKRSGVPADQLRGGLGADPIGVLAASGELPQGIDAALAELGALAAGMASQRPGVRAVRVDATPYLDAGAGEAQELAAMLSTGAAYLRAMSEAGLSVDAACAQIEVTLGADADVFSTIAKLRAARRVWAAMCAACGASEAARAMQLHVRTAERMMTRRDPWVNLLRVTAAAFAAGVAGADEVTTLAYDAELGEPEELGRRLARNTQLLLQEEAHVGRVVDPAGGSWYVETLTDQLATAAWERFGALEAAGGLPAVLLDGSLAAQIAEVRDRRLRDVATRKQPLTGVSEFPDIAESPVTRPSPDLRVVRSRAAADARGSTTRGGADTATRCEPLPNIRWAQEFEALRDASDAYKAATGNRPQVFLVNLGPVAVHTARATFAKNFFEAGGIEAVTSERGSTTGFTEVEEVLADLADSSTRLACLCSSDAVYAERAEEIAVAIAGAGVARLYLAGNPGERREAESAAGVDEFIHLGVDVLDVLRRAHETIGTPMTTHAETAR